VRRVVRNVRNQRIFNLGLRNLQATNTAESYRIIAGSDTQVKPSDARLYIPGHVFLSGIENDEQVTIGYSSGSKVWATSNERIPLFLDWCRMLGQKIRTAGDFVTNTALDSLAQGEIVDEIPAYTVMAQWHKRAFLLEDPVTARYVGDDGRLRRVPLIDLELHIDKQRSTPDIVKVIVSGESIAVDIDFTLSENADDFFTFPKRNRRSR
jgi:hypothetical protein